MAVITGMHLKVCRVREVDGADIFGLEEDVAGVGMTSDAVTGYSKRLVPVVTRSAGPAFFHLIHTNRPATIRSLFEDFRMTKLTFKTMPYMVENNYARGTGLNCDYLL